MLNSIKSIYMFINRINFTGLPQGQESQKNQKNDKSQKKSKKWC